MSFVHIFRAPRGKRGKLILAEYDLVDEFLRVLFCASALLLNNYFFPRATTTEGYLSSGEEN